MEKLSLDVQIHICEFLHPSQILALRQISKAFHEATSQRIVWIHALIRTCHQNLLFLPTFPIHEMSVAQLERAATAPRRWIALSSSKDRTDNFGLLPSRTVRYLKGLRRPNLLYLVPGGRYLVSRSREELAVWDLGYVSDSNPFLEPTKIWVTEVTSASIEGFFVHPTLDGLGIRILVHSTDLSVFEIYPQKEITQDAKVAELTLEFLEDYDVISFLYGNRIVIYALRKGIVIVWDFMANTMASWSVDIPSKLYNTRIFRATETAIMIRYWDNSMCIFQIPPLVTRTPLFGTEEKLPEVAPILTFKYFDTSATVGFPMPNCWYNDGISSFPLYFDVVERPHQDTVGRYKLNIASDFSTLFLTPASEGAPIPIAEYAYYSHHAAYRICENDFVTISLEHEDNYIGGTRLRAITSGHEPYSDFHDSNQTSTTHVNFTPLVCRRHPHPPLYSFCPASGRLIHGYNSGVRAFEYVICDFL